MLQLTRIIARPVFFESVTRNFLSPLSNVHQNPGCDTFSLVFDEGCDKDLNVGGTFDLDFETCDLLPFIINTQNDRSL